MLGFNLRSLILGVPPVLPAIRDDLGLTFTATGVLVALPVLCLGAGAIPGAVLVNRFGASAVVGAGAVGLGVAGFLRLAPPLPASLYIFSALMGVCAALAQPAMASVIRTGFPRMVQRISSVFAVSLGLGGLAGSSLSVHIQLLGGWRLTFVVWSVLALAAGLLWVALAPRRRSSLEPGEGGLLPVVREPAMWMVAAIFGIQSFVYYGSASWIPFELRPLGPGYLSTVLLLLNLVGIPVGLLLVTLPWPWATSRRFYALAGSLMTVGTGAFAVGLGGAWFWVMLVGIGGALTFTGTMALPALLARRPSEVASYAAAVLTLGYAISFAGPFLGGVLLDFTHRLTSPFWPMVLGSLCQIVLGLALPRPSGATEHAAAGSGLGA